MLHLASMSCPNFKDWLCENDQVGEDNSADDGSLGDRLRSWIDGYSRGFFSGSSKDLLHCTARFLRKGMEIDEELHMEQSRSHRLRLVALMLTKDTFGARVQLNEEQLTLWHDEEIGESNRTPPDEVTSKSCVKASSKQGADEVVSKSTGGEED